MLTVDVRELLESLGVVPESRGVTFGVEQIKHEKVFLLRARLESVGLFTDHFVLADGVVTVSDVMPTWYSESMPDRWYKINRHVSLRCRFVEPSIAHDVLEIYRLHIREVRSYKVTHEEGFMRVRHSLRDYFGLLQHLGRIGAGG